MDKYGKPWPFPPICSPDGKEYPIPPYLSLAEYQEVRKHYGQPPYVLPKLPSIKVHVTPAAPVTKPLKKRRRVAARHTGYCLCGKPVRPNQFNCHACHSIANKRLREKKKEELDKYEKLKIKCAALETEIKYVRKFPFNWVRIVDGVGIWLQARAKEFKPGDIVVVASCMDPTATREVEIARLVAAGMDVADPEAPFY